MEAREYITKFGREWFNETDELDNDETGYVKYPDAIDAMNQFACTKIMQLFTEIEHGDEEHRKWLKDKMVSFCKKEGLKND